MPRKTLPKPRPLPTYQHAAINVGSVEQAQNAWLDRPVFKSRRAAIAAPPIIPQSDPPTPLDIYRAILALGPFAQDYLRHLVRTYGRWNAVGANDPPGWPPHIIKVWGEYTLVGDAMKAAVNHFWEREATEAQRQARADLIAMSACAGGCGLPGQFNLEGEPDNIRFCYNCIVGHKLTPRKVAKPPPMPDDEIARRRAAREAEEAVRRWRGDDLTWDRQQPVFLTVPHRGDDGLLVAKMVGKIDLVNVALIKELQRDRDRIARKEEPTGHWRDLDELDEREPVFYHAHTKSQRHHNLDCPAPLDTVVADFLRRSEINWVFCYEQAEDGNGFAEPGILRFAPIHRFRMAVEVEYDGRWRHYLTESSWDRIGLVSEHKRRGGDRVLHVGRDREIILESPWIPESQRLVLKKGKRPA